MLELTLLLPLATQVLKVIEQAQISFNNAPPEYREQYYKRLARLESLFDPLLDRIVAAIEKHQEPSK